MLSLYSHRTPELIEMLGDFGLEDTGADCREINGHIKDISKAHAHA